MQALFEKIYQQKNLSNQEMTMLATAIFKQQLNDNQISALLIALKLKGVTADELTGLAHVMQSRAIVVHQAPQGVMDNCGTGGDHSNSFNISTTAAFVLAAGGIPMAKHGNRSVSSRSGSADVLESLGVDLSASAEKIDFLLNEAGIAFLFAPAMHPAMKTVMQIRKDLATPTIFNLIGPIINPYPLEYQLLGTFAGDSLVETATALGALGRKQAIVLQGASGMDEANLAGVTRYAFYQNNQVVEKELSPEAFGLKAAPLAAIVGGDALKNKEILLSVLQGEASPYLDTVILNAGLGFLAGAKVNDVASGIQMAQAIIKSGAAFDCLQHFITLQEVA
ncbi:anthranilate phosphoribosyltransferase [Enterococcus sp. AZ103]|uniref:anthranilate phosphoribosyltransferase n=1 Tax=Enterococcus sp. AZ103 TaxID=2774628 RepID=UPI003F276EE4